MARPHCCLSQPCATDGLKCFQDSVTKIVKGITAAERYEEEPIMAGKFLKRGAIVDVIKSRERMNAIQKREGLSKHPTHFTLCGCPDPDCGGWHTIITCLEVPTDEDCKQILRAHNKARKRRKCNRT
jgi:hypothetical protein